MDQRALRERGLKATTQRLTILEILARATERHLSAEEIYRELLAVGEEAALATVYRVLTQFEHAGLVKRRHFEGGQALFELNNSEPHDHLICERCWRVEESVALSLTGEYTRIACETGFRVTGHECVFYGICTLCGGV